MKITLGIYIELISIIHSMLSKYFNYRYKDTVTNTPV